MQLFTLETGWELCRKDLRYSVARLRAAGSHGKQVTALMAALASWKSTDTEREEADDAVDDANAVVGWVDEQLDERVTNFSARLLVAAGNDRKAPMYTTFFRETPSDVTRLALEAEVQHVAAWRHVREEVKLPDDVAAALDEVHALEDRGREALRVREDALRMQGRVALRQQQWREEANLTRREVETALDAHATKHRLARDYSARYFRASTRPAKKRAVTAPQPVAQPTRPSQPPPH